ncbi:MAG: hypothetical protein KDD45_16285 [Bdellovibrionales bacterium]|nr:hypothetical protein [Bdellovibrionales bacterium]
MKKIKKEKILPPINMNLQQAMEDGSMNSLFNSTKKEDHEDIEEHKFSDKVG